MFVLGEKNELNNVFKVKKTLYCKTKSIQQRADKGKLFFHTATIFILLYISYFSIYNLLKYSKYIQMN